MKAIDSPFHKIINGASQFIIPVFQRDHSWTAPCLMSANRRPASHPE